MSDRIRYALRSLENASYPFEEFDENWRPQDENDFFFDFVACFEETGTSYAEYFWGTVMSFKRAHTLGASRHLELSYRRPLFQTKYDYRNLVETVGRLGDSSSPSFTEFCDSVSKYLVTHLEVSGYFQRSE